jgi:hypothetical protein
MIRCGVYLLRIFKMFHRLMNNPVVFKYKIFLWTSTTIKRLCLGGTNILQLAALNLSYWIQTKIGYWFCPNRFAKLYFLRLSAEWKFSIRPQSLKLRHRNVCSVRICCKIGWNSVQTSQCVCMCVCVCVCVITLVFSSWAFKLHHLFGSQE